MQKRFFDILLIFLLGLLPLLWFPGNTMLFGHDAGLPFDPVTHFLDRFSVWSQRFGIGTDQSFGLLGAILIHGLEAVLMWLGFSLKQQQLIQFVFWFVLPGFTMYFFAYKTWPKKRYLPLIASVIYMLNFYLIQGWFIAERTKFSIYAAIPFLLYFAFAYILKKTSWIKSVVITGLVLALLNGGGSIPLYGGIFLMMTVLYLYINLLYRDLAILKRTIFYTIGVIAVYILLNAYWIFSYVYYLRTFFSRDLANVGGTEGALVWSTYLSSGSSFFNLFRGQGVPEWYLNPYHAYAHSFLTNPILIIVSFVFPLLAYGALFFVKEKRDKFYLYFFVLLSLLSLIFMSGPQSQFGFIYEFCVRYVPGFAIFRSNFYKFGYVFWFSYAILIGFTLDILFLRIMTFFKRNNLLQTYLPYVLPLVFIVGYLFYHYPVLNGSFLDYNREPGKEATTRVTVPQYILDFGKWSNQQDSTKRYLIVPEISESGYIVYQWHYWSLAPVTSLMTKNSFVQNTSLVPADERLLMLAMYHSLVQGDIKTFNDFAEVFAIDGIVVNEDFDWQHPSWGTTDPAKYEKILDNNAKFKQIKTFGKWKVYDIADRDRSLRVTATPKLNFLKGQLQSVMSFPEFDPTSPLFMADADPANSDYFVKKASDVFISPQCVQCDLQRENLGFTYYNPKVLPGSVFYPFVLSREKKVKEQAKDFSSSINYYLTTSDRRMVEAKWMIDSGGKIAFFQKSVESYLAALKDLKAAINTDWGVSSADENKLAQTIDSHLLQQVALIDSIIDNEMLNIDHRKILNLAYDEVLQIKVITDKKQWVTEDIRDKKYVLDLPKTGIFDLYVKRNTLTEPNANADNSSIVVDGSNAQLTPLSEQNDWIYFGKMDQKNTKLRLSFKDSTMKNLITDVVPEFPDGSEGIIKENDKFELTTLSSNKCFTYTLRNLETTGTQYLLTFGYRNFTEKKELGFFISDVDIAKPQLQIRESLLSNTRTWGSQQQIITPKKDSIKLNFCNNFMSISDKDKIKERSDLIARNPGQIVSEIEDISVYKVSQPTIILYQKQKDTEKKEYVTSFKKLDSVTYAIHTKEVKEPVSLVMRETYAKSWQLCERDGACLDDINHFSSAGFANGWYLKEGLKGDATLFYSPQKIYTIGAYLSIGSLLVIIGGICWKLFKRK